MSQIAITDYELLTKESPSVNHRFYYLLPVVKVNARRRPRVTPSLIGTKNRAASFLSLEKEEKKEKKRERNKAETRIGARRISSFIYEGLSVRLLSEGTNEYESERRDTPKKGGQGCTIVRFYRDESWIEANVANRICVCGLIPETFTPISRPDPLCSRNRPPSIQTNPRSAPSWRVREKLPSGDSPSGLSTPFSPLTRAFRSWRSRDSSDSTETQVIFPVASLVLSITIFDTSRRLGQGERVGALPSFYPGFKRVASRNARRNKILMKNRETWPSFRRGTSKITNERERNQEFALFFWRIRTRDWWESCFCCFLLKRKRTIQITEISTNY